jgi:hypothetical protein
MADHPQLAALAKKFPASVIHQVPVGGGKNADFVAASLCIEKVLAVCGPYSWSVRVMGPALVIGTLTVEIDGRTVSVDGVGAGGDEKVAESDAFKRAAKHIGVALHLWSGDDYRLDRALRPLEVVTDE